MKKTLMLVFAGLILFAAGAFSGREWGMREAGLQSLTLGARTNLALQLTIAQALQRGESESAKARLDASINSLVIELDQLMSAVESSERLRTEVLLRRVAKYRNEFPDSSAADGNPSASTVQEILLPYAQ